MAARLPDPHLPWPLVPAGVALLAESEGCVLRAYRNFPNEPWTCGWGETDGVGPNTVWTQEFADQRFCDSMRERVDAVLAECTVEPNEHQLAAMVSLAYNIGMGWRGRVKPRGAKDGFRQSTVLRLHNRGDFAGAARAFKLWNKRDDGKGGLVEEDGLTARRLTEAALYLRPVPGAQPVRMPQAVAAESSLAKSPLVQLGGAVASTGGVVGITNEQPAAAPAAAAPAAADALAKASETAAQANEIAGAVTTLGGHVRGAVHGLAAFLGCQPSTLLVLALVGTGVAIVYWRVVQRRRGWA